MWLECRCRAPPTTLRPCSRCVLSVFFFFVFDSVLVAAAVSVRERTPVRQVWREHFAGTWRGPAACGYIGWLVAVYTEAVGPQSVVALLPLPVIAYQMFLFRSRALTISCATSSR